jgi:hypothetical protein
MTAESELFVDEMIRDIVQRVIHKNVTIKVPKEWKGIWEPADYPVDGIADILEGDEKIGTVEWDTEFFVDDTGAGRFVNADVKDVVIKLNTGEEILAL